MQVQKWKAFFLIPKKKYRKQKAFSFFQNKSTEMLKELLIYKINTFSQKTAPNRPFEVYGSIPASGFLDMSNIVKIRSCKDPGSSGY
jgi:hypothetical protein